MSNLSKPKLGEYYIVRSADDSELRIVVCEHIQDDIPYFGVGYISGAHIIGGCLTDRAKKRFEVMGKLA